MYFILYNMNMEIENVRVFLERSVYFLEILNVILTKDNPTSIERLTSIWMGTK